jgi:dolichyl-phosphate beta-glucosyltransferase
MDGLKKNLTLIVPVYNEAKRWDKEFWKQTLSIADISWVFVNDGSSDSTSQLLTELKTLAQITILEHPNNLGKAEAVRSGFNYFFAENSSETSEKFFIGFIDGDGAFNPAEIERFLNLSVHDSSGLVSQGFQAIWTSRVQLRGRRIERKRYRHYLGRIIASFLGLAYPSIPYDSQSGFKIFLLEPVIRQVFLEKFKTKWFVDLEIAARYQNISGDQLRIWEEPLFYWKDIGKSTINIRSLPRISIEILWTYRLLRRSTKEAIRK